MPQPQFGPDPLNPIDIGVEIEVPIRLDTPVEDINARWKNGAGLIVEKLKQDSIPFTTASYLGEGPDRENGKYDKWHICHDPTTFNNDHKEVAALEFSSPVWKANEEEWKDNLEKVEGYLCPRLAMKFPQSFRLCSTHIHFSFPDHQKKQGQLGDFPVTKARLIMFAAFMFEDVLDNLFPKKDEPDRFTKRNTKLKNIEKPEDGTVTELGEIWNTMREVATLQTLHKMVCWEPQHGKRVTGAFDRNFKWNISGGGSRHLLWKTVEYRQLPPMTSEGQLVTWVNFILGFVGAATSIDPQKLDEAANKGEKAVYGVYGLEKRPSGFADIKQFIEQFIEKHPSCNIDKERLKQTPDIRAQVQAVLSK